MGKCYKAVKAKERGTLLLAHTLGAMVGAVMRAVNPNKSDIRSIRPVVECGWVRMLWLIFLAPRGCLFRLRLFQFTHRLPQKKQLPQNTKDSDSIWDATSQLQRVRLCSHYSG